MTIVQTNDERKWYVLYTKPKHEFKAKEQIEEQGTKVYLPTYMETKKWSDRKKTMKAPVFRGYVFIYATHKERVMTLDLPTIFKCIFFDGKPAVIPDDLMENLMAFLDKIDERLIVSNRIEIGRRVKINHESFLGFEGIVFEHYQHGKMFGVTVELLNRTVSVRLPAEYLELIQYIENGRNPEQL